VEEAVQPQEMSIVSPEFLFVLNWSDR
jgi:hypothetical protein